MPARPDAARQGIGFGASTKVEASEEAVKKMFAPEFRNRLDAIVPFDYLGTETVSRVVDKFILQLELQLGRPETCTSSSIRTRAAGSPSAAYDKLMGARPMARLIQDKVKQPLAEELLFGKLRTAARRCTSAIKETARPSS
jgi:ATP-dependent Clp protease ATP-binding subunit ClpA